MLLCILSAINETVLSVKVHMSAFNVKGSGLNPGPSIFLFVNRHLLQYMLGIEHLSSVAKPGLLMTLFSLVNKHLCSPGLKHCLNVY